MSKLRRPSPALVVSIIALVVASAGTATAATVLIRGVSEGATAGRVELNVGGTIWVSLSGLTFRAAG